MSIRCAWLPEGKPDYTAYHDTEWGVPVYEDRTLFEMLILEGAQAGLSWYSVLKRREGYRQVFHRFDVARCAVMTDAELEASLLDANIIRNRLKVFSVRSNAQVFLALQNEFGSFSQYLWRFVDGKPKINRPRTLQEIPYTTPDAQALSKDLKTRGMRFVGEGIMYAYMQAVGLVDDHVVDCFLCKPS